MGVFFRIFFESVVIAFHELSSNKLRSILSLLGITIGIFCIITVLTAVDSLQSNVQQSIQKLGDNVVYVQKWPWAFGDKDYPWWEYMKRPTTKYDELRFIEDKSDLSSASAIEFFLGGKDAQFKSITAKKITVAAVSQDYNEIYDLEFEAGRYFSMFESHGGSPVAILGNNVATSLFHNVDQAIGETVKVMDQKVRVIGVLKKEGEDLVGFNSDNNIILPYNYAKTFINVDGNSVEPFLVVEAKPKVQMDELKFELTGLLRAVRKLKPGEKDNFAINQISLISQGIDKIFSAITFGGWFIGGFSLLVGCFGIANIMFVSVRERTAIIGIKKALGAKGYFILSEFLVESIVLCMLGGIFGMTVTFLLIKLMALFVHFKFTLTLKNVMIGSSISIIIGVLAGIIPAIMGARMKPVDAMRH